MIVSYFDLGAGHFCGVVFSGPPEQVPEQCPPGCYWMIGAFDPLSQRVNLETGAVEDYQPERPADTALVEHHWLERRWVPVPTLEGVRAQITHKLQRLAVGVEAGTDRWVREQVIADATSPAYGRMQAIETELAPIRKAIQSASKASTKEQLAAILLDLGVRHDA